LPCALVYRRADDTSHAQLGLLALQLLSRATLAAALRCITFFLAAHVAVTLLTGVGALVFQPAILMPGHMLAVSILAIFPLALLQLASPEDESVARHLPSKYEITKAQTSALIKALLLSVLPTLLCIWFVFASCLSALWPSESRYSLLFGSNIRFDYLFDERGAVYLSMLVRMFESIGFDSFNHFSFAAIISRCDLVGVSC